MMFAAMGKPGAVTVMTSSNGGHTPEQIAELCVERLIKVSDSAPPEIAMQARAYREQMLATVLHYVRLAAFEDRSTVTTKLEQGGYHQLARQLRSL
jgi:hypothetical protein